VIRLTVTDGAEELRHLPVDWLRPGVAQTVDALELLADAAGSYVLWTSEAWLEADVAGAGFVAVGTTRATALDLGAFTAGQRKTLELRVTPPASTPPRRHLVELRLGLGV
jgi:hypothetical protein